MKKSKFVLVSLLFSSLVLSSCAIGPSRRSESKTSTNDSSENNNRSSDKSSNTGKQSSQNPHDGSSGYYEPTPGLTELTKEQWEKAFSYENIAFNSNYKVVCTDRHGDDSSQYSGEMTIISKADYGKWHLEIGSQTSDWGFGHNQEMYFSFDEYLGDGHFNGWQYNFRQVDNSYSYWSKQAIENGSIGNYLAEISGILEYPYDAFKYNKNTKRFIAESYDQLISDEYYIHVQKSEISFIDGLPSTIIFDYKTTYDEYVYTFSSTFSDFGEMVVTFPEDAVEEQSSSSEPHSSSSEYSSDTPEELGYGVEIKFDEFKDAFNRRLEAPYDHLDFIYADSTDVDQDGNIIIKDGSADLVYGQWQVADDQYGWTPKLTYSFILNEQNMRGLEEDVSNGATYHFYFQPKTGYFTILMNETMNGRLIEASILFDSYFYYVDFLETVDGREVIKAHLNWEKTGLDNVLMKVSGREFVGIDVLEKDYDFYNSAKMVTEGATIRFDYDGRCAVYNTMAFSGDEVRYYDTTLYGSYTQVDDRVVVSFAYFKSGADGELQVYPAEAGDMEFTIVEDTIRISQYSLDAQNQEVYITQVFAYSRPFNDDISFNENQNTNPGGEINEAVAGDYVFKGFVLIPSSEDDDVDLSRGHEYVESIDISPFEKISFTLEENGDSIVFNDDIAFSGTYLVDENQLIITTTLLYHTHTGSNLTEEELEERDITLPATDIVFFEDGEIRLIVNVISVTDENPYDIYIYAVYSKLDGRQ